MSLAAIADKTIKKPRGQRETIVPWNAETQEIMQALLHADKNAGEQTKALAKKFSGSDHDKMEMLWHFVKDNIQYKEDGGIHQKIQSPEALWKSRKGDCKSFSLFVASMLQNWGIPYVYRFTGYNDDQEVTHVYVVAYPGKRTQVIIDGVHDKFNDEAKYSFKRDMTRLSYISGRPGRIGKEPTRQLPVMPPINYSNLTKGELGLVLLDRKLQLVENYYGDPSGVWAKARNDIYRAVSNGVHTSTGLGPTGHVEPRANFVYQAIQDARRKYQPAGKALLDRAGEGTVQIGQTEKLTEAPDCSQLYEAYTDAMRQKPSPHASARQAEALKRYQECAEDAYWIDLFNKYYADSAHHLLYFDLPNANSYTAVVAAKSVLHKTAVSSFGDISELGSENVASWMELGVMRKNASVDLDPLTPFETVELFSKSPQFLDEISKRVPFSQKRYAGIGEPITIAAIVKLVGVIASAVLATKSFLESLKDPDKFMIESRANGISNGEFGPNGNDFSRGNNGKDGEGGGFFEAGGPMMLPLILGGAGLYFFTKQ